MLQACSRLQQHLVLPLKCVCSLFKPVLFQTLFSVFSRFVTVKYLFPFKCIAPDWNKYCSPLKICLFLIRTSIALAWKYQFPTKTSIASVQNICSRLDQVLIPLESVCSPLEKVSLLLKVFSVQTVPLLTPKWRNFATNPQTDTPESN